mgnify:CR=1 FL=1
MARNRVIYSNEILMVSPTATGIQFLNQETAQARGRSSESLIRQIKRTQSINYNWNINRSDINQYGNLARIDSVVLESPTVNLDFTYLLTDGKNEHLLGFDNHDGSSLLSKDFIKDADGRNFYIVTSPEGKDAAPDSIAKIEGQGDSNKSVIALGNCYLTNYSINAAVGGLPTVSASAEAFNIRSSPGTDGISPGIGLVNGAESTLSYKIPSEYILSGAGESALRPGDLNVTIGGSGLLTLLTDEDGRNSAHIQSLSVDVPLPRTTLQRVGNQFGYSKSLDMPINMSISISAIVADQAVSSHSLFEELYANNKNDLTLTFRKPSTEGAKLGDKAIVLKVENATLDAENYGMAIGDNRTVDYTFSATIGGPDSAGSVLGSTMSMQSSGIYEQLQVIETGKLTDDPSDDEHIPRFGTAIAANDKYLVVGASGFVCSDAGITKEAVCAYISKNNKGFYSQILQTSGNDLLAIDGAAKSTITNNALLPDTATAHDENFGCSVSITKEHLVAIGMSNSPEDGAVAILEPDSENDDVFRINSVIKDGVGTDGLRFADAVAFDKKGVSGDGTQFLAIGNPHYDYPVGPTGGAGQVAISFGKKGQVNSFHGAGANVFSLSPSHSFMATPVQDDGNASPLTAEQHLGESVAMYDRIVVAGAPKSRILATTKEVSGAALVWMKAQSSGTAWHQWKLTNILTGTDWGTTAGQDQPAAFGTDVDIFDQTMAIGAPSGTYNSISRCGAVFMFTGYNGDFPAHGHYDWNRVATLTASDSAVGDRFGNTVSMPNSHTLVVGAPGDDSPTNAGSLYVFTGYDGNWTETQKIRYTGAVAADKMGRPEDALATTQKEIFVGGASSEATAGGLEKVIRYRI